MDAGNPVGPDGSWIQTPCDQTFAFICQMPAGIVKVSFFLYHSLFFLTPKKYSRMLLGHVQLKSFYKKAHFPMKQNCW